MTLVLLLLFLLFVCFVVAGGYYAYKNMGTSTTTLTITEDGAFVTGNYKMREQYIQAPSVKECHGENPPPWCGEYDKSNEGFAFVYDLSLGDIKNPLYTECPAGGHACWYTEKYDSEGTLTAITDKDGVSLLDKIADDIWDDKLDSESPLIADISSGVEMKDGSMVAKKNLEMGGGMAVKVGEKLKPTDLPATIYFVALFVAMKTAGMKKPGKIVLNVANAKDTFDKMVDDPKPSKIGTTKSDSKFKPALTEDASQYITADGKKF